MPQISVVVPVYNAELYLQRCVNSILSQAYSDFELILVDDGSQDGSGQICDEYAAQDSRVVVIHKKNGGVSSARNIGLEVARGKYITFVDSDDWICQAFFQQAVCSCEKNDLDMYLAGFARVMPDEKQYDSVIRAEITCFSNELPQDTFADLLNKNYTACSMAKLIRKETIGKARFDTSMNWGEDLKFVFGLLAMHIKIQATPKVVYYYRVGHISLTSSSNMTKCSSIVQTYGILYHEIIKRGYPSGQYQSFLDGRCYSDLLYTEQLILGSHDSIHMKIKKMRILLELSELLPLIHNSALKKHLHCYGHFPALLLLRDELNTICTHFQK